MGKRPRGFVNILTAVYKRTRPKNLRTIPYTKRAAFLHVKHRRFENKNGRKNLENILEEIINRRAKNSRAPLGARDFCAHDLARLFKKRCSQRFWVFRGVPPPSPKYLKSLSFFIPSKPIESLGFFASLEIIELFPPIF